MKNKLYSLPNIFWTLLLLVMAMVVPRQAYAGAHFGTIYDGDTYNSRISHHPTVNEPWITVYFWFYDTWGGDGYFLHDETERGHKGPAVYVDGKYICSPDWELAWSSGNGNASGLDDQRGNNGWWGSTYTNSVDGVNYTVRFWDPRKVNGQFWVEMVIYMDKMAVATEHDVKIRGKWKLNGDSSNPGGSIKFEERTFRTQAIRNIFSDSPNYERTYGSLKVTRSSLNTSYGPTTVAMTTDGSYYKDYGNGKRYFDPSTMNQAVYKTYSKGSSTYNGLTLSYNETDGSSFYLYRQKSITVTPNDRPSTIIFGWQMDMPYRYDAPCNVDATTDMWKKQILLTWQASGGLCYANGTWSIYRYPDGHPEDKTKVASDIPYNTRKYTDDVPDYDQKYVYQIYFVPTNSPSGKLLSRQMESTTQFVQRSFPINITDVVSDKKSITVKWQCPEFKGNESYAFKLLRTESKNGQPGDDWTEVATVNVTDKGKTQYEYTDTRDLKLCPTYIYKVQTTMLENKLFSSTNILEGRITGNSQVTAVNATKGDYNGLVKVAWEADQVGADVTRYEVARRVKGTDTWATIYKTSGTASSYYYEDQTALPGQYYDYKVVSITTCDGSDTRLEKSDDGFSRATGIVSGRITYGTGTAVAGTRVALVRGDGTQQQGGQFYALRVSGAGDGVFLSKDSETLNKYFASKPYTLQMMIRPDDSQTGTTPTILDLGGKLQLTLGAADTDGKGYPLTLKGASASASTGIYLKPNAFTSLTLAVDAAGAATVTAVNADDSVTVVPLADKLNAKVLFADADDTGLCLGGSYQSSADRAFTGYIDEMRVFSDKALSREEILANYNHTLCGTEDALVAYWPVDEGFSGQTTAYDYSKTSGVANGNHARLGAGTLPTGSIIPTSQQLGLFALTDTQGNFVIRGVPFTGEGTNYMVIPALGVHEFSPTYSTRYVSASSLVHSGVDFTDVSSFPVSGTVFYEGTDYPVEGCTFYVDGTICSRDGELIQSAEDGTFTISVPIGDHFIQVKKDGHVFASAGRYPADPNGAGVKITFEREIKNMEFIDQTLVNFTGRVVGGSIEGEKPVGFGASHNNIGITELVLSPTNDRYRLNVVKKVNGTSYSYETNTAKATVESATSTIASHSWRGAGDAAKKIFIRTDSLTGEFSAMVPPLMYNVESIKVVATGLSVGDATTVDATNPLMQLTDTLVTENGARHEYAYNCKLRQTYHSAPSFTVTQRGHDDGAFGLSKYEIEDANGKLAIDDIYTIDTNGKVTYNYGGAIFESEENYTFDLKGFEEYVNHDVKNQPVASRVPLSNNVVTINNALSASQSVYLENNTAGKPAGSLVELESNQLQLDSLGCAVYTWKAGLPNITAPYTRTLSISYDIDDRTYNWDGSGMNGIILGSLPTGNNFVTSGPDVVEMILRDPPGTGSSAEWTSGTVTSKSTSYGGVWSTENEVIATGKFGFDITTLTGGIGIGKIDEIKNTYDASAGLNVTTQGESASTWSRSVTTTRTISTSSASEYVGANGDVFIGSATNLIYGLARDVNFRRQGTSDKAALELKDVVTTGLNFKTMFNYTENYVENVLLPNLRAMRNSLLQTVASTQGFSNTTGHTVYLTTLAADDPRFGSSNHDKKAWGSKATKHVSISGPSYTMIAPSNNNQCYSDSVEWCNSQIQIWENTLAANEKEKVLAYENREKHIDQNFSFDSGSSVNMSTQVEESHGSTTDWTLTANVILDKTWIAAFNELGVETHISTRTGGGTHNTWESGTTKLSSFSYTLAEEGDDDALTVDVYKYGAYSPIFRTRGGQTSGPYEGEIKTKYYRPGTTIMEATMQIEVPHITVDVPTVSNVPTGSAANYTLRLTNASEIDEDVYYKLLMIDESNPDGAKITIDGMPLTDNRIIKIPAGQTVTKAMQLWQTNTSVLDYKNIGIVLASQSQYDPTSTWDQIADTVYLSAQFVPSSSAVTMKLDRTTLNSQTGDDLNISFNQFDRDYHNLKAFRIQYRKQGDTDWTLVREYVINEADKTQNNELLPSTATVSYKLPMHNFSDGDYTFRILSVSTYGNEEVYNTSEEIALVKDMQRPQPLGMPTPTNGILSPGDDVSIEFNENFLKGELTKTANFIVTGVLNGAEVSHATALGMTGTANTASTEADINLAGKSFAIDAWVKLKGAGTLLSHGKGQQKLVVGVDDNRHLQVKIGSNVYTSKAEMPTDKWAYLTMNYAVTDKGNTLKAAVAEDATTTDLFTDETVAAYEGNGPLAIGQHMTGAIHELTLWDEAHDMTAALMEKNKTKNPATRHLIGYWKMDEGEGTVITDYARNRHLRMPGENWYLNNENKAITLDGTSHLDIPTADVSPLAADNCAIELWMRADKQKGETQLLQAGEVELWMNTDGVLQLTSGDNTFSAGTSSLQDKAWHHVALNILRNGNAAVYVDGERTMATSVTGIGTTASDRMIVGARRTLTEYGAYKYDRQLVAGIDEIRLWNATLSADILKSRRKMRLNGTEQGLVAYYPFEKNTLDAYNQVVTVGTDDDMLRTDHKAVYADALTFTDEAPALREKKTETNVDYSFTASDNKIVITLNETPATIAACTLNFTVRDLRDVNGNLSLPVCWSAYINNNELAWSENSIKMTKKASESHTFEASFTNKSGKQQMWTISGMPSWLKADTEYGTVDPLATETISFEVTEATPVGKYDETVYLTGNDGIATPLTLSLTMEGDKPDWTVDKGKYESTMSIIGTLSILGKPSYDADDIVGVFVDGECRGIAHPAYNERYDNSFLLLDVYGNDDDAGKVLTFKAYDASTGIMYPVTTTSQDVTFSANVLIGKYAAPLLIETADKIEQTTLLSTGWNWTSFYVNADDMNVSSVFASVADGVETVKTKDEFANCDKGTWYGKTFDVDNRSMYKARMSSTKVLKLIGRYGSKEDRTITVVPGWNWIAYNNTQTASVADALAGMDPQDGDMIKGQYGFALFDGYEWTGSLKALTPGQGYMLQSASANVRTFNYPSSLPAYVQKKAAAQCKQYSFSPIDHHKYPSNMTITARVTFDGAVQQDAEVGVFAGDECRTAEFTDADGYAYFTVPGDGKCTLRFMLAKDGQTWLSDVTLDFAEDAICGSYKLPFEVTFGKTTFIDGITADDDTNTRWYDLNGMLLNGKPSVSGVYMRSTYDANTGMTVTRKVVLK
ncbi:hypothetical protein [Prevotella sp.]|uniref:hypothetical protein n=1 Tax=Prevotella sp. TaxID=59823 RepID=UPI0025F1CF04|nr:hypothetical protein [Prevotella sp.]MCI6128904.1 LamG domain-containing protein [Prevotella sp.]